MTETTTEPTPIPAKTDLDRAIAQALHPAEPMEQPRARPRLTTDQRRWLIRTLHDRDIDTAAFSAQLGDESRLLTGENRDAIDVDVLAAAIAATIHYGGTHAHD